MVHVILSGGVGSRLWPLSRKTRPKQYIPLFEQNRSLFQLCVLRNRPLCDRLLIVGNRKNQVLSLKSLQALGIEQFDEIVEATPRNTAAAITFAALKCNPEEILLVTPSDHIISNQTEYEEIVKRAQTLAEQDNLVTIGIRPDHPETGFGYIHYEGENVIRFVEKPPLDKAKAMLKSGDYLWNSGMFCFRAGLFLAEMEKYAPEVLKTAKAAFEEQPNGQLLKSSSLKIPSISVDYAVMEHSDRIKVIPSKDLGWSDLGTFKSLQQYKIQNGETQKNLIIGTEKPVFFIGTEQMAFIETKDAILILPIDKSQEVKDLYEKLERDYPELTK